MKQIKKRMVQGAWLVALGYMGFMGGLPFCGAPQDPSDPQSGSGGSIRARRNATHYAHGTNAQQQTNAQVLRDPTGKAYGLYDPARDPRAQGGMQPVSASSSTASSASASPDDSHVPDMNHHPESRVKKPVLKRRASDLQADEERNRCKKEYDSCVDLCKLQKGVANKKASTLAREIDGRLSDMTPIHLKDPESAEGKAHKENIQALARQVSNLAAKAFSKSRCVELCKANHNQCLKQHGLQALKRGNLAKK